MPKQVALVGDVATAKKVSDAGAPKEVCLRVDRLVDVDGARAASLEFSVPRGLVPSVHIIYSSKGTPVHEGEWVLVC